MLKFGASPALRSTQENVEKSLRMEVFWEKCARSDKLRTPPGESPVNQGQNHKTTEASSAGMVVRRGNAGSAESQDRRGELGGEGAAAGRL